MSAEWVTMHDFHLLLIFRGFLQNSYIIVRMCFFAIKLVYIWFLDSVLSMDIPSTGPTSLRSEIGDDMGPIVEAEEAFLRN